MKFNKLTLALALTFMAMPAISNAQTIPLAKGTEQLYPVLSKRGNPVKDARGNCVKSKWTADQCCNPCLVADAPKPTSQLIEKEKIITYVDLVRQSVYFNIDKDNIDMVDDTRINDVIAEIKKSATIRDVKIVGYADRFAGRKYNFDLSKRRATNVLNNFRQKGYLKNIVVGFGFFGKEKPVTNCPTNAPKSEQIVCLQADRRVDIELELVRERIEKVSQIINNIDQAPQYPKPGTYNVEVYSKPINSTDLQQNIDSAVQPNDPMFIPAPGERGAMPVMPAPNAMPASMNQFRNMQQNTSETPIVPVSNVQQTDEYQPQPMDLNTLKR